MSKFEKELQAQENNSHDENVKTSINSKKSRLLKLKKGFTRAKTKSLHLANRTDTFADFEDDTTEKDVKDLYKSLNISIVFYCHNKI